MIPFVLLALAAVLSPPSGWAAERTPAATEAVRGARAGSVARARFLMGTPLVIEIPGAPQEAVFEEALGEVARLEEVLSNWREDSEVSRLNRQASERPFRCSADLFAALEAALRWAEATGGAFDPTVEPLVRRYGLRPAADALPAGAADLVAPPGDGPGAGPGVVGWRHVRLDAVARSAAFDAAGMGIDFGGIGKGIALDAAAGVLRARGVRSALLDFGGQVLALGASPGEPAWTVEVADPDARRRAVARIRVRDLSLATSGNAERGREGKAAGHILDPRGGAPPAFAGSVTVAAPEATAADALSTALFVMGPEAGTRWAEGRDLPALFLWRGPDGVLRSRATRAFEKLQADGEAAGRTGGPPSGTDRHGAPCLSTGRSR
ncbi:MAG: FAD:protein FMN transferase [Acidobacteria bacterium]|nr:FAD:protein FMN transferase [Acidobacteriota bacterium]